MNGRYLFKAKRIDNGEWVEGFYWTNFLGNHFIRQTVNAKQNFVICDIEIDETTLCQYTGLIDKNSKRIWENDVVAYEDAESDPEGYHDNVFVNRGKVFIEPYGGVFFSNRQTVDMDDLWISNSSIEAEVIGNIFDNQELLEDINETP